MAGEREYQTPRWQTLGLAIAFLALVAIGIATVLLPELEDEPEVEGTAEETSTGEAFEE